MSTSSASSLGPVNPQVTYLRTLQRSKKGLPHGQLVCVSASHTITTTEGLLHLASSVGPHIAILKVHSDLIDDWSQETVRKLVQLSKKYGFLIWEGGRVLNPYVNFVGKQRPDSRAAMKDDVDAIRKSYTRGPVSIASWAGLATAWASGITVDSHEVDILIPALKSAARETVAGISQTITTEITAEGVPSEDEAGDDGDDDARDENKNENYGGQDLGFLSPDSTTGSTGNEFPFWSIRKSSVISLTQTITQHTEPSEPSSPIPERHEHEHDLVDKLVQSPGIAGDVPPPPVLARGLVLCLPSASNTLFTPEYRRSCLLAARTNRDFVLGFICNEPWTSVSQRDDILDDVKSEASHESEADEERSAAYADERLDSFVVFSTIPVSPNQLHTTCGKHRPGIEAIIETDSDEDVLSPATVRPSRSLSDALNPQAALLHAIIDQALASRKLAAAQDNKDTASAGGRKKNRSNIIHIPIVTLGLWSTCRIS